MYDYVVWCKSAEAKQLLGIIEGLGYQADGAWECAPGCYPSINLKYGEAVGFSVVYPQEYGEPNAGVWMGDIKAHDGQVATLRRKYAPVGWVVTRFELARWLATGKGGL
jgi:hypothetical protein